MHNLNLIMNKYQINHSFLGWLSSEESVDQCRRHKFYPRSGNIPHASEQLILCFTPTEPTSHRACAPQQEKPSQWEAREP